MMRRQNRPPNNKGSKSHLALSGGGSVIKGRSINANKISNPLKYAHFLPSILDHHVIC